ncbi:Similar to KIF18A: Kinesin-like protein KIF18A (Homo sapiens) [Cotesia congregata]|uniref:Similar to KIF18A: Kinesin-like protein KIF18A (Homo sapiens) n=1 Tax=Cotesia congregata TaxID=51543 RepID=A0A8J2H7W1_COTCN|nr:Similar to KIF18A: Kinesin-like protein KIF18A (Homo sapiens) [Cotesia congregata]
MVLNKNDLDRKFSPNKSKKIGKRRSLGRGPPKPSTSGSTSKALKGDEEKTSIKVIVRVRPANDREDQDNFRTVVKVIDDKMMIFDPKEEENPFFYRGVVQKGRDLLKKQNKELQFIFDHVFDITATNEEVFEGTTKEIINDLLEGYNCSVFAYGATGAGKTHTMLGKDHDPGITYRTMAELFNQIDTQSEHRDFNLGVTYLALREDGRAGVVVSGLKIKTIKNAEELLSLLAQGNRNRTQHPTDANAESSRSHAVFQVYVNITNKLDGQVKQVKLSMIDLAGSERASATGCKGARFKEGANINKSLLALGNCINNLAEGIKHIPYRDSKLTRLLKDSLGGNCRTVMIANIGPSSLSYEDTYNTLRYANRAKKIKTHMTKNIISCEMHVTGYKNLVDEQKKEIAMLKQKLLMLESRPRINSPEKDQEDNKKDLKEFKDRLIALMENRLLLNEKILALQSADKILCCRIQFKISADKRLQKLTNNQDLLPHDQNASGKSRVNKSLGHFKRQRDIVKTQMEEAWTELRKIEKNLAAFDEEARSKGLADKLAETYAQQKSRLENARNLQQIEHTKKISSLQQCELDSVDTITKMMSNTLQSYYSMMRGYGTLTEKMKLEFKQLIKSLEGVRNIKWADADLGTSQDAYTLICLSTDELADPLRMEMPIHLPSYNEEDDSPSTPPCLELAGSAEVNKSFEGTPEGIGNSTITLDSESQGSQDEDGDEKSGIDASQLNNTFNLVESKAKKRVLVDKGEVKVPLKQVKRLSPKSRLGVASGLVAGKENKAQGSQKPVSVMSAKSVAILNKLKTERAKLGNTSEVNTSNDSTFKLIRSKERREIKKNHPYMNAKPKINSTAQSSRVPW